MTATIRDSLAAATAYLREHRDEARYTDGPATARLGEALRVSVSGANGEGIQTDMPAGIGGRGESPGPGWLLRAAQASCAAAVIGMRAAAAGVDLGDVTVTVDSESDDFGILGLDAAVPAGPLSTRVAVTVRGSTASESEIRALVTDAVEHCPVVDAVRRAVPTTVHIEVVTG